jgi:3-oxoacyl-[acyl-carrier protein] reductase
MPLSSWQQVVDVNLTGVFLCGREAAAHMVAQDSGGLIVSISSISRHGTPGQSNYTATKAGIAAMTVVWAKELARYKVRAAAIAPGYIATEMTQAIRPEILDKVVAQVPWGRLGDPAEISHTLRFIIENDYVNGRVMEVDGGLRI